MYQSTNSGYLWAEGSGTVKHGGEKGTYVFLP